MGVGPGLALLSAYLGFRSARRSLRVKTTPSAPGMFLDFVAAFPWAHAFARLRFAEFVAASVARLAIGSGGFTPGRAGYTPAGLTEFHDAIASICRPFLYKIAYSQHSALIITYLGRQRC